MNITPCEKVLGNSEVGRQITIESSDMGHARDTMMELCCDHQLQVSNASEIHFRHSRIIFPSVQLTHIEYGVDARVTFEDAGEFYIISLPICGSQELRHGEEVASSDSEHGIVISPGRPVYLEMNGDCKKRLVQISRIALERQLATLLGRPVKEPVVFDLSMDAENGPGASWWRTVRYLEQEQHYSESLYIDSPFLGHVEQMLISGLLYGQHHNYSSALQRTSPQIVPSYVRRAELFIHTNARESITMDDIVHASGAPRRTLFGGFKRFRGDSPMNFLRTVRMQGAREDLLNDCTVRNVTSVAMHWGFTHLGRFSTGYRERFGESPSDSMKRNPLQLASSY